MSVNFSRVVGILLLLAGIGLLIHPNVSFPSKKSEVHLGSARAIIETRRVISVPKSTSWILVACGGVLVLLGVRRS
ncbi:MAG TPA: hypothetical protein VMJ93_12255 [Verrucomicrobiae bacterium]|nr:hypothetical protein [Verrucomicrobiae bacterium]